MVASQSNHRVYRKNSQRCFADIIASLNAVSIVANLPTPASAFVRGRRNLSFGVATQAAAINRPACFGRRGTPAAKIQMELGFDDTSHDNARGIGPCYCPERPLCNLANPADGLGRLLDDNKVAIHFLGDLGHGLHSVSSGSGHCWRPARLSMGL